MDFTGSITPTTTTPQPPRSAPVAPTNQEAALAVACSDVCAFAAKLQIIQRCIMEANAALAYFSGLNRRRVEGHVTPSRTRRGRGAGTCSEPDPER